MFFFNDTATTEIYTLSLHDALPICTSEPAFGSVTAKERTHSPRRTDGRNRCLSSSLPKALMAKAVMRVAEKMLPTDRKSTRLNSSHANISYAVFCLKKKKTAPPF